MRFKDPNRPPEKNWPAPPKPASPELKLGRTSSSRPSSRADASPPPPVRPRLVTGPRRFARLNDPADAGTASNPDSDVRAVLRHNVRRDRLSKRTECGATAKGGSSRGRDFWVGLLIGNLTLGGLYLFLPQNIVTFLFIAGGMAIYSVGFTWLMFSVSDDY